MPNIVGGYVASDGSVLQKVGNFSVEKEEPGLYAIFIPSCDANVPVAIATPCFQETSSPAISAAIHTWASGMFWVQTSITEQGVTKPQDCHFSFIAMYP